MDETVRVVLEFETDIAFVQSTSDQGGQGRWLNIRGNHNRKLHIVPDVGDHI